MTTRRPPRRRTSRPEPARTAHLEALIEYADAHPEVLPSTTNVAVSATNGCEHCIASHTAAARQKGMTEAQHGELLAVTGMANQTNALVNALRVPGDDASR